MANKTDHFPATYDADDWEHQAAKQLLQATTQVPVCSMRAASNLFSDRSVRFLSRIEHVNQDMPRIHP